MTRQFLMWFACVGLCLGQIRAYSVEDSLVNDKTSEAGLEVVVDATRSTQDSAVKPNTTGDSIAAQIWPGDTFKHGNVVLTWEVKDGTSEFVFRGPSGTISLSAEDVGWRDSFLYIDCTTFQEFLFGGISEGKGLKFAVKTVSNAWKYSAAPADARSYYASTICPLTMNNLLFTVSSEPVEYPDGSKCFVLKCLNLDNGLETTIPAVGGTSRDFDRFRVSVTSFFAPSKSADLDIEVLADERIQGGETWLKEIDFNKMGFPDENYGNILGSLAEQYDFEVQWVEFPEGHPESVEFGKGLPGSAKRPDDPLHVVRRSMRIAAYREILLKNALQMLFQDDLSLEWTDPRHLRVWAKNYDKIAASNQETANREAKNKDLDDLFEKDYTAEIEIYSPKTISPAAAKAIADPLLSHYILGSLKTDGDRFLLTVDQLRQKYGRFVKMGEKDVPIEDSIVIHRETVESAIVDEKSESLIVTAVPSTHKKLKELLGRMENAVAQERHTIKPPFQIEIVLLRGYREEDPKPKEIELRFAEQPLRPRLYVARGTRVAAGDPVAHQDVSVWKEFLDTKKKDLDAARKNVKTIEEELKGLAESVRRGAASEEELTSVRKKLEEARLALKVTETDTRSVEEHYKNQLNNSVLKAPVAGTITATLTDWGNQEPRYDVIALLQPDKPVEEKPKNPEKKPTVADNYGINKADMNLFGFNTVAELGKVEVSLIPEPGSVGKSKVALTDVYTCDLDYIDTREPYVIARCRLLTENGGRTLMDNTLYLEQNKSAILGLTNLKEAVILVIKRK